MRCLLRRNSLQRQDLGNVFDILRKGTPFCFTVLRHPVDAARLVRASTRYQPSEVPFFSPGRTSGPFTLPCPSLPAVTTWSTLESTLLVETTRLTTWLVDAVSATEALPPQTGSRDCP